MVEASRPTRRRLEDLCSTIEDDKASIFGFALYWTWMYVLFWSGLFSADSGADTIWFISVIPSTLALLVVALLPKAGPLLSHSKTITYLLAACMMTGVALIIIACWATPPIYLVGSVLTGIGLGSMTAFWGWLLARNSMRKTLSLIACSTLLAAIFSLVISSLTAPVAWAFMLLIPFVSSWLFQRAFNGTSHSHPAAQIVGIGSNTRPLIIVFFIASIIMGLLLGMIRGLLSVFISSQTGIYIFSLATFIAGLLLLLSWFTSDDGLSPMFFATIVIIAGAFAVLVCLVRNDLIAFGVQIASTTYFISFFWVYCANQARSRERCIQWFSAGIFLFQACQIIGKILHDLLYSPLISSASTASYIALVASFLVLALSVILLADIGRRQNTDMTRFSSNDVLLVCDVLAESAGLTDREREIFRYLVQGRDRAFIAEQLVISPETVKTHVGHIYTKFGLHSKQDLITMVDERIASYDIEA